MLFCAFFKAITLMGAGTRKPGLLQTGRRWYKGISRIPRYAKKEGGYILSFWRKKTPIQMAAMDAAIKSISMDVVNFIRSNLWKKLTMSTIMITLMILFLRSSRLEISRSVWKDSEFLFSSDFASVNSWI
jgi:hypothetical protein